MLTRQKLIEDFPYHVVVVISPHPDDSCIAVGGLLHRLATELGGRCRTHVLIMTTGYRGVTDRFLARTVTEDPPLVEWSDSERKRIAELLDAKQKGKLGPADREFLAKCRTIIRHREVEQEAACLRFKPHFLDLSIYEEHTINEDDENKLSAKLCEVRAEGPHRLLIMPGRYEQHQTHRLASDLVSKVIKDRHPRDFETWAYESPWSVMMPRPDVVVPLTEQDLKKKIEATCCHKSQLERTPYAGIVEGTAVKTASVLSEWLGAFDVARALDLGPYAETYERLTPSVVYG